MNSSVTDEEVICIYFVNQPNYCFELLYSRHYSKVFKQCLTMTRNTELAQDFSQDIFIRVFEKLAHFQQRSRFSTARRPGWIYAIAHNYCHDQLRQRKQCSVRIGDEFLDIPLIDKTETPTCEGIQRRLTRAMESLSYDEQSLMRLRYEQELSIKQVASLYGLTISAVKMRIKRSRAKMKRSYAQQLAA